VTVRICFAKTLVFGYAMRHGENDGNVDNEGGVPGEPHVLGRVSAAAESPECRAAAPPELLSRHKA
jgi:hypothetical protein